MKAWSTVSGQAYCEYPHYPVLYLNHSLVVHNDKGTLVHVSFTIQYSHVFHGSYCVVPLSISRLSTLPIVVFHFMYSYCGLLLSRKAHCECLAHYGFTGRSSAITGLSYKVYIHGICALWCMCGICIPDICYFCYTGKIFGAKI